MTSTGSPPTGLLGSRADLKGHQIPRLHSRPPRISSASADQAIRLARSTGLSLLPWQQWVLHHALGTDEQLRWSAFEVALLVARQNGKGGVLEALELAHLFLFGSQLIVHSAHRQDTAAQAQARLWSLIQASPKLLERVHGGKAREGNGKEGIRLKTGALIRFTTRTNDGGRGLSGDLVVLDEAMDLPVEVLAALLPTMRARPNPQMWYVGSPVDQDKDQHGQVLADVRSRGVAGDDPDLAFAEWSAGEWDDYLAGRIDLDDRQHWAAGNPSLGYLVRASHMAKERRSLRKVPRKFVIELLGIGDWPRDEDEEPRVIEDELWASRADEASTITGGLTLVVETDPRQKMTAIGVAGTNADGRTHVECVEYEPGLDWVVKRVLELVLDHDPDAVVIDERSPANAIIPELRKSGIEVTTSNTSDMVQACGMFLALVTSGALVHLGQDELAAAIASADKRPIGDQWGWSRKGASGVQPLVAVTLAAHHHLTSAQPKTPPPPPAVARTPEPVHVPAHERSGTADLLTAGF